MKFTTAFLKTFEFWGYVTFILLVTCIVIKS